MEIMTFWEAITLDCECVVSVGVCDFEIFCSLEELPRVEKWAILNGYSQEECLVNFKNRKLRSKMPYGKNTRVALSQALKYLRHNRIIK